VHKAPVVSLLVMASDQPKSENNKVSMKRIIYSAFQQMHVQSFIERNWMVKLNKLTSKVTETIFSLCSTQKRVTNSMRQSPS